MNGSGSELVWTGAADASPERLIHALLQTLTSEKTKQAYATALGDFFAWTADRREPPSKSLLETWRGALVARGLSVSSVNQRLSAVRLLFRQAADRGARPLEEALRLVSVANVKEGGQRLGNGSPKETRVDF